MTWWTGNAIGFDTETDGPVPTEARIITAATVLLTRDCTVDEHEVMVKPVRDIPQGAINVHGITTERAQAEGMERRDAVLAVVERLSAAGPECPVVGHNVASYDLTLLDREMRRTGVGWMDVDPDTGFVVMVADSAPIVGSWSFPVIDTLVMDKAVDRYRRGSRKLEAVAAHYRVPMEEGAAHGATADVIAALRIAIALANRGQAAGMSLSELHQWQGEMARDQANGLRGYFAKKGRGEDAAGVRLAWPFQPYNESEETR